MLSLLKEEGVSFVTFRDIALSQDVPNALP